MHGSRNPLLSRFVFRDLYRHSDFQKTWTALALAALIILVPVLARAQGSNTNSQNVTLTGPNSMIVGGTYTFTVVNNGTVTANGYMQGGPAGTWTPAPGTFVSIGPGTTHTWNYTPSATGTGLVSLLSGFAQDPGFNVTVTSGPPAPTISITATPQTGVYPLAVNFASTSTNATSITWAFGDGTTGSGSTVAHTYSSVGTYTAVAMATNSTGSATANKVITVTAPVANPPNVPGTTVHVDVYVQHSGVGQSAYNVSLASTDGAHTYSGVTTTGGHASFDVAADLTYNISAWGTSSGSTPKADSSAKQEYLAGGQDVQVVFNFQDDGSETGGNQQEADRGLLGGLQKIMQNTATSIINGIKQQIQDALTYLFVPSGSIKNDIMSDLQTLINWGPFTMITDINTALGATSDGSGTTFTIPGPQNALMPDAANGYAFDLSTYEPSWFRTMLGAGIYLGFAFALIRQFMPRQQL